MVRNANHYNELLKSINHKIRLAKADLDRTLKAVYVLTLDGFELGPLSAKKMKATLVKKRRRLLALVMVRRNIKRNARTANTLRQQRD